MDDRRTLHLTFPPGAFEPTEPTRTTGSTRETALTRTPDPAHAVEPPAPRRTARDRVLVLAEHLVGDWASTLRMALGMLAAMVAFLAFIAVTLGPLPALIGAGALTAVVSTTRRE